MFYLYGGSKEGKLWFALGRLGTLLLACRLLAGVAALRHAGSGAAESACSATAAGLPISQLLTALSASVCWPGLSRYTVGCRELRQRQRSAAALFSTVVMKIGLLGILTLSLLGGNAPLWWGGVALLVPQDDHRLCR